MTVDEFKDIYKPHYNLCDDILKHIGNDSKDIHTLTRDFLAEPDTQIHAAFDTLEKDGFVKIIDYNAKKLRATGEGVRFKKEGGYFIKMLNDIKIHQDKILHEKNQDRREAKLVWLNRWIALGAIATVIYYIIQTLINFHLIHSSCH